MDVEELADAIGENVRRYRQALGWSQDGLAQACGLSKGTIVAIEQQRSNPSVATLCALAESLGVGLQTLLERPTGPMIKVRRPDDAVVLWSTPGGSRSTLLMGTDPPAAVEVWAWTIAPGDRFEGSAHARGTKETIHVQTGSVEVVVAGRACTLQPGDVLVFEAHEPHSYACAGPDPVTFAMWIIMGDEGEVASSFSHAEAADG